MMLVTADQIVCHLIGDYVIQSDWMAAEKTKKLWVAFVHAMSYSVPFWFLIDWDKYSSGGVCWPIVAIVFTHAIIDRWRLARYLCWMKNFLQPKMNHLWSECSTTGYHKDRPVWMAVWLMIITDNTIHVLINAVAIRYLP